jgi:hypothetical protein
MTGRGVSASDMPNFPRRPSGGVPPVGDAALDELLATGQPPPDAAPGLLHVADVLAALQAGPSGSELAGKTRAMAEFRGTLGTPRRPRRVRPRRVSPRRIPPRRPGVFRARISTKIAAGAAAVAVAASAAAAAYVGALPGPLQKVAHVVIAAPPADAGAGRAGGVGLTVPGRAAFGLCTAYRHASTRGVSRATAFRELAEAAGGAGHVRSFCASMSSARRPASRPAAAPLRPAQPAHAGNRRPDHPGGERPARPGGDRVADPGGKRHVDPGGNWAWPPVTNLPWPQSEKSPWPPAGQRPGHPAGDQPAGDQPAGHQSARPHDLSPREAVCGSAPGTQRPSHVHPRALSGQSRGC